MPLVNLAGRIRKEHPDCAVVWLGEKNGLERTVAEKNGIAFFSVHAEKLRRYFSFKTFFAPFFIFWGIADSLAILRRQKISLVFSKGGFVSLPVVIAAKLLRIPVYLHESDTVPGLANKIAARFAQKVFLGFASAKAFFADKTVVFTGQMLDVPLMEDIRKSIIPRTSKKPRLVVTMGSQGSARLLEYLLQNPDALRPFDTTIILGTKNTHFRERLQKNPSVRLLDFVYSIRELLQLYAESDLAISRGSATTLAELSAFGVKTIIIPLPETGGNHQYFNALEYQKQGQVLLPQKDMQELEGIPQN